MDAERFGRALGRGVRAAGKAMVEAADAAASPDPRAVRGSRPQPAQEGRVSSLSGAGRVTPGPARGRIRPVPALRTISPGGLCRGGKRFAQSVWTPAARAGSVLWYEVTGSFFALFTLAAGAEVWRHRRDLLAPASSGVGRVYFAVAMLVVFGWFTLSSFLRARRRAKE